MSKKLFRWHTGAAWLRLRHISRRRVLTALLAVLVAASVVHFGSARIAAQTASGIWSDGFESGSLSAWTTNGGLAVEKTTVHDGSNGAQGNTTAGGTYAKKLLPATYTNGYARVFVNVVSRTGQVNLLRLRTAADGSLGYLFVSSTGKLSLRNDVGAVAVTSATSYTSGWHALEFHAVINGASSSTEVWLDDVKVNDLSITTNLGTTPIGKVQIGEVNAAGTYNVVFDNVVFDVQHIGSGGGSGTPTATATTRPTATKTPVPPTATKTSVPPTATTGPTATKTAVPPTATVGPTPTRTAVPPTPVPGGCTAVVLTKGPNLSLTGSNTTMNASWQWSANSTFQVRWGTSTSYASGSVNVSARDTTNHLYTGTMSGLTPGTKYYYQVAVGSQCVSSTFYAPPAAAATAVKFFAYGDTRSNGSTHNGLAGQVNSAFTADPAFQTLNINVGDWVSADSEAAWTAEWFPTSYTNLRKQDASLADIGVRGNHEGGASYWKRYFPQPWQSGGLYYSFDYGPMHVAMLDQYTAYNAGSAQYNWLKSDLAASTKKWKFVVLHEPGWSAGGGHGNNTTVQNDLQPLFVQYGVSIVFGGHNHYYARATVGGIQQLTVGGGGAPLYTPASGYANIVTMTKVNSFGEFTINGSTLTAKILNNSGATIDSFTITR